jgi:RimJ/RimL family protein N-acetyltransferase
MAWADIAVSAGGTTCWEMSYMGLPMLVITLEDNQVEVAHSLAETGAARSLGWHNQVSVEEIARAVHELCRSRSVREEMSAKAAALVDGEGSSRLVAFLRGEPLRLRRVREEDCGLLWEWINEPEVRSMSFSSQHIPWEDHVAWFISRIDSSDHILMIALNQIDEPVGLVRFDLEDDEATISIVIDPRFRGQGYGSMLIKMGSRWLLRGKRTRLIHAYIKPQNLKSSSAFERAGYQFMGSRVVRGQSALHYVLEGGK